MKRAHPLLALCLAFAFHFSAHAGPRDADWARVQDAMKQGLPATAITNLEPIITGALQDKAYAEATKAIATKIALQGQIEGNHPEEKIVRLQAEIDRQPPEMQPVLTTVLAHWYWEYFEQNRWRFMQRTATGAPPGKDFTTWDLPRLFAEIDRQFQKALSADQVLKATPISAWDDLIQKGTMPDRYRPTLYDFLAHEALDFYMSGEQAGAQPEDAFQVSPDDPIFDAPDRFIAWQPETTETNSPALRALRLYQDLLRFHEHDAGSRPAFADADLERLEWGWNVAVGDGKNVRFKAALERFIQANVGDETSAFAYGYEANVLQTENDLVAAHRLAEQGEKLFPQSPGGVLCHNIIVEIETKSAAIATERVWNTSSPRITVNYRNVGAVYFRAIPVDWEMFLEKRHNRPENLSDDEKRAVLAMPPALTWSTNLPPTTDYQQKTVDLPAPAGLKPGFYFIAASHDPNFRETDNQVSMANVFVSDLALITRTRAGNLEGFVTEAASGEPVAGADISVWHLDRNGNRIADKSLQSDENGFFSIRPTRSEDYVWGYLFRVRYHGQELATVGDMAMYGWYGVQQQDLQPNAISIFFTDRAIYRPGQTVQYKGVCLWVDKAKDDYQVLKGEPVTVVFRDSNGKEIARQSRQANDYGSFAGSFTAPRDRLMGSMSIQAEGRAQGQTSVQVEEYKRPKFEVTLEAPATAAKLNEKVGLTGHATSYTGAAVDDAAVTYHVMRQAQMPWWWWGRQNNNSQEIAHGTIRTATDGSFKIDFKALPDSSVSEKDDPSFDFTINAEVTDNSGETRTTDRSIRVGYTALEAMLTADEWQTVAKPAELKLATRTLDGEPQAAKCTVKVYSLQAPAKVQRAQLSESYFGYYRGNNEADTNDLSEPNNWPLGKVVAEKGTITGTNGEASVSFKLPAGIYRAVVEAQDRYGKQVTGKLPLRVLKPDDTKLAIKVPEILAAPQWSAQPGDDFMALWGTGYAHGRALVEIEHRDKIIERFWTGPGRTQQKITLPVTEDMRGGFTVHVTQVRENRAYLESRQVEVPWKNKELDLKWEHFTSKLQPGAKETWTAVITGPKAEKSVAEMVATLYDASLDAFMPHEWTHRFDIFRTDESSAQPQFANVENQFAWVFGQWHQPYEGMEVTYRHFPEELAGGIRRRYGYGGVYSVNVVGYVNTATFGGIDGIIGGNAGTRMSRGHGATVAGVVRGEELDELEAPRGAFPSAQAEKAMMPEPAAMPPMGGAGGAGGETGPSVPRKPDLNQISARQNLNETAFFYPQLRSDSNGVVRMTFTMPEALTKWRFMAFAHDQSVRSGFLEGEAVSSKDLMVQPNPPRFLREDDTIEFTVKVSNQSDAPQIGTVRLTFDYALNGQTADSALGNTSPEQPFEVPAKESRSYSWRIHVPDGCGFLTYKAVGATATLSDGEEGAVPVLSRRVLVTESLPLPIRGPATNQFKFTSLLESGASPTLKNQSLTVQMVSNPAWYAVRALPYLMEYPYECSEQTFNRLYANALARHIAGSDPKIRRVFDQWKNMPALDSPLEKNQDLKSVMLEETPWVQDAEQESQARRNIGILFDDNRLDSEMETTSAKLTNQQLEDGRWPWFPGGPADDYITLYIVTGYGRLRHLGVDVSMQPALRAIPRLDEWMTEDYLQIQKQDHPEDYVLNPTDALYLYGRSFYLGDVPIAPQNKAAIDFFVQQARKLWLKTENRQSQGQLALALKRWGGEDNLAAAQAIMKSIKERSVTSEEMGRYWRDTEMSWWWYQAPIETQALMIEAFDEVMNDQQAVEDCRVWLLKQKQTQNWKTTKATADAVYALLLRGVNLLSSDALVDVRLGDVDVTPSVAQGSQGQVEAGTGFYEHRFAASEITPALGDITVGKTDAGVAWGSVHWQYFEDLARVKPYEGTPLKLEKALFIKHNTATGPLLEPLAGEAHVGDELVVRLTLRVDRDMEYVHLKDQRGSGTEPVNVLSQYKYQDGLGYYESTRDTASHFFINYLPKGTYVFEYSTRVQLRGEYQSGVAEIQCMYAPEFNSHSQSVKLVVK